jgi:alkanesulfonate monooxygenase
MTHDVRRSAADEKRRRSMARANHDLTVELFSTCPASTRVAHDRYRESVIEVAQWSEEAGCTGILVYADNNQVDPWLVAQIILQHTATLCPLVAVQPIYMHPYSVAKMVTSLAHLYGRRVYLNMVAGGFKNDLAALHDPTPHDKRYDRLVEYTTIIQRLLAGDAVCHAGEFYAVDQLRLTPPLPPELAPGVFVSGSSEAGLAAAHALGATAVKYPKPAMEEVMPPPDIPVGVRVGIIAREDEAQAWALARARFPEDRRGQLTHQLAMKVSDSVWHRQLSGMAEAAEESPYWLVPFENYQTMCPYLVGSETRVSEEIGRYVRHGYRTFILDIPASREDLHHIRRVFVKTAETVGTW